MKCYVLFSQGSVRTLVRQGGHFFIHEQKISSSLHQCKNYKNRSRFSKVMVTNVLPPFFMVHSVFHWLASNLQVTKYDKQNTVFSTF